MKRRPYGSKPTLALWMLIAVADAAVVVATAGPLTVLGVLAGLVLVVGGIAGLRQWHRRGAPEPTRRIAAVHRRA